jgi:HEAT repeat protein
MHTITKPLALSALAALVIGCNSPEPTTPSEQTSTLPIPSDAPAEVRKQLEQLTSPDSQRRAYAAFLLGTMGEETTSAVPHLLKALEDENRQVRSRAAEALGTIGDLRAVEPLIQILETKDEDWEVRSRVAGALGNLKDAQATDSLVASLADMVSHVRYQAAIALGELGGPAAEEALASTVQLDADPTVRFVAQESLRKTRQRGGREGEPVQVMDEEQVRDKET